MCVCASYAPVTQQFARVVHGFQQLLDQLLLLACHLRFPLLSRSLPVFPLHGIPDTFRLAGERVGGA
jgi:hypothetical protein